LIKFYSVKIDDPKRYHPGRLEVNHMRKARTLNLLWWLPKTYRLFRFPSRQGVFCFRSLRSSSLCSNLTHWSPVREIDLLIDMLCHALLNSRSAQLRAPNPLLDAYIWGVYEISYSSAILTTDFIPEVAGTYYSAINNFY